MELNTAKFGGILAVFSAVVSSAYAVMTGLVTPLVFAFCGAMATVVVVANASECDHSRLQLLPLPVAPIALFVHPDAGEGVTPGTPKG